MERLTFEGANAAARIGAAWEDEDRLNVGLAPMTEAEFGAEVAQLTAEYQNQGETN